MNATQVFPPAKSKQKEVGVKLDFGNVGATLAWFEIIRPSSITDPVTNIFSIDGEQRNRGIELETFGAIRPGLRILGGVAYIAGKLTKTDGGVNDRKRAVGVPEFTVNLGAEWETPWLLHENHVLAGTLAVNLLPVI